MRLLRAVRRAHHGGDSSPEAAAQTQTGRMRVVFLIIASLCIVALAHEATQIALSPSPTIRLLSWRDVIAPPAAELAAALDFSSWWAPNEDEGDAEADLGFTEGANESVVKQLGAALPPSSVADLLFRKRSTAAAWRNIASAKDHANDLEEMAILETEEENVPVLDESVLAGGEMGEGVSPTPSRSPALSRKPVRNLCPPGRRYLHLLYAREGMSAWTHILYEAASLARDLNRSFVEPCVKGGQIAPCYPGRVLPVPRNVAEAKRKKQAITAFTDPLAVPAFKEDCGVAGSREMRPARGQAFPLSLYIDLPSMKKHLGVDIIPFDVWAHCELTGGPGSSGELSVHELRGGSISADASSSAGVSSVDAAAAEELSKQDGVMHDILIRAPRGYCVTRKAVWDTWKDVRRCTPRVGPFVFDRVWSPMMSSEAAAAAAGAAGGGAGGTASSGAREAAAATTSLEGGGAAGGVAASTAAAGGAGDHIGGREGTVGPGGKSMSQVSKAWSAPARRRRSAYAAHMSTLYGAVLEADALANIYLFDVWRGTLKPWGTFRVLPKFNSIHALAVAAWLRERVLPPPPVEAASGYSSSSSSGSSARSGSSGDGVSPSSQRRDLRTSPAAATNAAAAADAAASPPFDLAAALSSTSISLRKTMPAAQRYTVFQWRSETVSADSLGPCAAQMAERANTLTTAFRKTQKAEHAKQVKLKQARLEQQQQRKAKGGPRALLSSLDTSSAGDARITGRRLTDPPIESTSANRLPTHRGLRRTELPLFERRAAPPAALVTSTASSAAAASAASAPITTTETGPRRLLLQSSDAPSDPRLLAPSSPAPLTQQTQQQQQTQLPYHPRVRGVLVSDLPAPNNPCRQWRPYFGTSAAVEGAKRREAAMTLSARSGLVKYDADHPGIDAGVLSIRDWILALHAHEYVSCIAGTDTGCRGCFRGISKFVRRIIEARAQQGANNMTSWFVEETPQ